MEIDGSLRSAASLPLLVAFPYSKRQAECAPGMRGGGARGPHGRAVDLGDAAAAAAEAQKCARQEEHRSSQAARRRPPAVPRADRLLVLSIVLRRREKDLASMDIFLYVDRRFVLGNVLQFEKMFLCDVRGFLQETSGPALGQKIYDDRIRCSWTRLLSSLGLTNDTKLLIRSERGPTFQCFFVIYVMHETTLRRNTKFLAHACCLKQKGSSVC